MALKLFLSENADKCPFFLSIRQHPFEVLPSSSEASDSFVNAFMNKNERVLCLDNSHLHANANEEILNWVCFWSELKSTVVLHTFVPFVTLIKFFDSQNYHKKPNPLHQGKMGVIIKVKNHETDKGIL